MRLTLLTGGTALIWGIDQFVSRRAVRYITEDLVAGFLSIHTPTLVTGIGVWHLVPVFVFVTVVVRTLGLCVQGGVVGGGGGGRWRGICAQNYNVGKIYCTKIYGF